MTLRHILIVPLLFILAACVVCCSGRSTIASEIERPTDTVTVVQQLEEQSETETEKTPLDTIVFELPDSKKLQLFVFSYYDSLPRRPIQDFILKEMLSGETLLRSVTTNLILGDEVDHFTGETDTIKMIPAYYVNLEKPSIELTFFIEGNLDDGNIEKLTCDLKYLESDQSIKILNFIAYDFIMDADWRIVYRMNYAPCACKFSKEGLLGSFNRIKMEGNLRTERGDELLKDAFICFSQGEDIGYREMLKEFISANGTSFSAYRPYTYLAYFDTFFITN